MRSTSNLYKYVSAEGLVRLLAKRSIRFTQPDYLNDPYECHLTFDRKSREALIEDFYLGLKNRHPERSDVDLRERAQSNEDAFVEMALENYRKFRNELGVLSLSETATDLLMWAHYADEHRGAVVELDYTHGCLVRGTSGDDEFCALASVNYTNTKVSGIPSRSAIIETLLTKSKTWEYEGEWRIIKTLNLLRNVKDDVFVADLHPMAIKKVIIGARFPEKYIERVRTLISSKKMKHVVVEKAVLMPHKFGIKVVPAGDYDWMQLHREHHFGEYAKEAMLCIPMVQDELDEQ